MLEYERCFASVVHSERHGMCEPRVDRFRQARLGATLSKVHSACLRLAAVDKIQKAIRSSPLMCFASCPGRQCEDMIWTMKLLIETSRMCPDRLLP